MANNYNKTALVFGATGLVGNEVTDLLLSDDHYQFVKIFVRRKSNLQHPKLIEVVNNLDNPDEIAHEIIGNEVFCCLGTTIKKAGSQQAFEWVDLHLPVKIAEIAIKNGVQKFLGVSSIGAKFDSPNFYLRTKGKMENEILNMGFGTVCMLRPSILLGKRNEYRPAEEIGKMFMSGFSFLMMGSLEKYKGIQARVVARAMIKLAFSDEKHAIVESDALQELGR